MKDETGPVVVNERFLSDVREIIALLDRLGFAEAEAVMEVTSPYENIYEAIESRGYRVVLAHPLGLKALTTGESEER